MLPGRHCDGGVSVEVVLVVVVEVVVVVVVVRWTRPDGICGYAPGNGRHSAELMSRIRR